MEIPGGLKERERERETAGWGGGGWRRREREKGCHGDIVMGWAHGQKAEETFPSLSDALRWASDLGQHGFLAGTLLVCHLRASGCCRKPQIWGALNHTGALCVVDPWNLPQTQEAPR